MTARFVSWTDPKRVAELLSQLSPPATPSNALLARVAKPVSSFGSPKPAGKALPIAGPPTPKSTGPRVPPPPPPVPAAAPEPQPFSVDTDHPTERLEALMHWVSDSFHGSGVFIADENGLTLAANGSSDALVSIMGPLLASLVGIRSVPGVDASAGALWLGEEMLSWVEVRTEHGGFCLGSIGPEALNSKALERLRDALKVTVQGLF